jgi:hypothetical protein
MRCAQRTSARAHSRAGITHLVLLRIKAHADEDRKRDAAFDADDPSAAPWQPIITAVAKYVTANANAKEDVPFPDFVSQVKLCAWLSQQLRAELWIATALRLPVRKLHCGGPQSTSVWPLFDTDNKDFPFDAATYRFAKFYSQMTLDELLVQQCCLQRELEWDYLETGECRKMLSANMVLPLAQLYNHPLKILVALGPRATLEALLNRTDVSHRVPHSRS